MGGRGERGGKGEGEGGKGEGGREKGEGRRIHIIFFNKYFIHMIK